MDGGSISYESFSIGRILAALDTSKQSINQAYDLLRKPRDNSRNWPSNATALTLRSLSQIALTISLKIPTMDDVFRNFEYTRRAGNSITLKLKSNVKTLGSPQNITTALKKNKQLSSVEMEP
jgi:hypothetical protein